MRSGVTHASGCLGPCGRRTAICASSSASSNLWRHILLKLSGSFRRTDSGTRDSSSGIGSILTHPPSSRGRPRRAQELLPRPACTDRLAPSPTLPRLIGLEERADEFSSLTTRTREVFSKHYLRPDGTIKSDAPTVYALAVVFGLLEANERQAAGDRLAELIREGSYHVSTGFAGTPYVLDALTMTGHIDTAYRMLLEQSCPSWLYPVTMGATTIWERWDSMLPDGSINPGEMTSFNHYALGAVADWMHRTIGGIAPLEPGYERVLIAPRPGGEVTWARVRLDSPRGRIAVNWMLDNEDIVLKVVLPVGVPGVIDLAGQEPIHILGTSEEQRVVGRHA